MKLKELLGTKKYSLNRLSVQANTDKRRLKNICSGTSQATSEEIKSISHCLGVTPNELNKFISFYSRFYIQCFRDGVGYETMLVENLKIIYARNS